MAGLAGGEARVAVEGPAIAVIVAVVAGLAGLSVVSGPVPVHLVAAILVGTIALLRPAWGLVGYFVLASTLPSSEGVSGQEIASFGLLAWLFILATLSLLRAPIRGLHARRLTASLYVLIAALLVNLVVAWQHDISFANWARDVAPLANLSLLAVLPAFIRHERDVRVVRVAFTAMVTFVALNGAVAIIPGLPQLHNPLVVGGTWVPALLVAAAAVGISEIPRASLPYIAMGLVGIANAVLSTTRTVWVGVAAVAGLSLVLDLRAGPGRWQRGALLALFFVLAGGGLFSVWQAEGSADALGIQKARWASLSDLADDNSAIIRAEQFREAMARFAQRPLLGEGLGYQYFYRISFTEKYDEGTNYNHSDLANSLCKQGVVGTVALYSVLALAVWLSAQVRRRAAAPHDRWFGGMVQIGLIAAVIVGNSCPVLQERGTTFLLGAMIGLTIAISANEAALRSDAALTPPHAQAATPQARLTQDLSDSVGAEP